MIQKETLEFLRKINSHNNKPWFEKNKDIFVAAKTNVEDFIREVNEKLNQTDVIESSKLFRIYREVRFSKDKTPISPISADIFAGQENIEEEVTGSALSREEVKSVAGFTARIKKTCFEFEKNLKWTAPPLIR